MLLTLGLVLGLLGQPAQVKEASTVTVYDVAVMPRQPVQSSNIASVGYDVRNQTLEVEFKNGAVYQYYGVPLGVYEGLMRAESHGRYLDRYVKKAGYRYQKIMGEPSNF